MKTKIKRHSRSVLSVVLALCMLVSCMTAGMIMTDAAKVDSGTVGGSDNTITDYYFKGSFDSWASHYVNSSGEAFINIDTAGTYEFVVITGGGTQRRADHTFTSSGSYNAAQDQSNFKIQVTTPGTYTFKTSTMNSGGSVTVTLTFPSSGSTTSTDWRLVDGDCNWTAANSTKKFALNSSTGYYEYTQYFTGTNYFRIYDGTNEYQGNTSGNYTITTGDNWTTLVSTTNDAFEFSPSTAGTYIVQVDATNKKIRIQQATQYTVTCTTPSNGTLTTSAANAYEGDTVTITATPDANYALKSLVLTYDGVDHDVTTSDSFNVQVDDVSAGGKLFIGWYDESGNRYNDSDDTQHNFTASATKAEDRIFEARFITAPNYRIDFEVPTRLWGNRIYKVFGKVSNSLINQGFIGYDSERETTAEVEKRYYLTGNLVRDRVPNETVFLKTITWPNIDDGTTSTEYNVSKTVTKNTGTVVNVETTTTGTNEYNLYRYVAASMTDQKVTVQIFSDCSKPETAQVVQTVNYGESINNNATVATNIPSDKTFKCWKIETLNSLGGTANGTLVTYDYSPNFNYVAYDNYKVTVELLDKEPGGTEYSPYASKNADNPYHAYAPTNTTSVINLGQTRSHWNDTETGEVYEPDLEKGESTQRTNANYNYDRLFIDLALSYSDGNETKLNTVEDLDVGFIIQYKQGENWIDWKTVEFSSKLLGDKNRIEYYYGFENAAGNRNAKFRVQPTIGGVKYGTALEFDFSADQFSAQTN